MHNHQNTAGSEYLSCCAKHFVDGNGKKWRPFQKEGTPPMWCRDRLVRRREHGAVRDRL